MPRKSRRPKYNFPILKAKKIVIYLEQMNVKIEEKDMLSPREDRLKFIYASILKNVLKDDIFSQQNNTNNNLSLHFEYPELHEKSVTQVRFMRTVIRFMSRVGVKDFCISDLISPEKKRTIRNLSAIINFAKFRNQKWTMYTELKHEAKRVVEEFHKLQELNLNLGQEFVKLQEKKKLQEPEVQTLKKEISKIAEQINSYIKQANEIRDEIHRFKKEIAQNKLLISERTLQLNGKLEQIRKLESQIVRNPEKLKKRLQDMTREVHKRQIEMSNLEAQLRLLEFRMAKLANANEKLAVTIQLMNEVQAAKQTCCKVKSDTEQLIQQRKQQQSLLKKASKELRALSKQLAHEKERFANLEQASYEVKQEIKHKLDQLTARKTKVGTDNKNILNQIQLTHEQIQHIREEIEQIKLKLEANQARVEQEAIQINQKIQMYQMMMQNGYQLWIHGLKEK